MNRTYFVWKRNDGHVASTCYMPRNFIGANKKETTFDLLGSFDDWQDAYDLIKENYQKGSIEVEKE